MSKLSDRLFQPVDVASLVFFRIGFGALMLWELLWNYYGGGWVEQYWIDPGFHFKYFGFEWLEPWPGIGMHVHFWVLGALALCIALGFCYRAATALFFLGFVYVFLLDQTTYLNHFYLISLVSLLLILTPAHRSLSIDARLRPSLRSGSAPAWTLRLLQAQIGIAYFYGGLAKLNGDWFGGEPIRTILATHTDFPVIGRLFTREWMVGLFSYGGLLLDLLVVPLLLWRRTRPWAFLAALAFHLTNARLFPISVFPWFMIVATTLFLDPSWPRKLLPSIARRRRATEGPSVPTPPKTRKTMLVLLALYLSVQALVPLRQHLYPGKSGWSYEGYRFAWTMILNSPQSRLRFYATDPAGPTTWEIDPLEYLQPSQLVSMSATSDMILQFAQHVADELRERGHAGIEVRAEVGVSLNGRRPQLLIDPDVDLAAEPRTLMPSSWIRPLTVPLAERMQSGDFERLLRPSAIESLRFGRELLARGKPDEAIRRFEEAVGLDPGNAAARRSLGMALMQRGEPREAAPHLLAAVEDDPRDAELLLEIGNALNALGDAERAAASYRQALRVDPGYAMAHSNLGALAHAAGRLDQAIQHYERALEIDDGLAEAHNNLGRALLERGKTDEAIARFRRALALDPDFELARRNLEQALR